MEDRNSLHQIVIAGVINGHIAGKAIYVRLFAGTDRMHKRDFRAVMSWVVIAVVLWVIAWIIASAIPVFDHLLSLITALFASWFTFGLPGVFWIYMNQGLWFSSPRKVFLTVLNVLIICIGCILVSSIVAEDCRLLTSARSVDWDCTPLGRPFMTVPAARAFLAAAMHRE
jgi:hypothetical protein